MQAKTRYGEPIIPGRYYAFATVHSSTGAAVFKVTEVVNEHVVRVDEHGWNHEKWACNALCEVER